MLSQLSRRERRGGRLHLTCTIQVLIPLTYLLNLRQVPHMAPAQSQSELVLSQECEARRRGANALHFALDFEDEPRVTQKRPLQYRNGSEARWESACRRCRKSHFANSMQT